jgi:hypothetical protein
MPITKKDAELQTRNSRRSDQVGTKMLLPIAARAVLPGTKADRSLQPMIKIGKNA